MIVEIKGTYPELTWGRERGRLEKYQSGQLAKLPRKALRRTDELMGTSKKDLRSRLDERSRSDLSGARTRQQVILNVGANRLLVFSEVCDGRPGRPRTPP